MGFLIGFVANILTIVSIVSAFKKRDALLEWWRQRRPHIAFSEAWHEWRVWVVGALLLTTLVLNAVGLWVIASTLTCAPRAASQATLVQIKEALIRHHNLNTVHYEVDGIFGLVRARSFEIKANQAQEEGTYAAVTLERQFPVLNEELTYLWREDKVFALGEEGFSMLSWASNDSTVRQVSGLRYLLQCYLPWLLEHAMVDVFETCSVETINGKQARRYSFRLDASKMATMQNQASNQVLSALGSGDIWIDSALVIHKLTWNGNFAQIKDAASILNSPCGVPLVNAVYPNFQFTIVYSHFNDEAIEIPTPAVDVNGTTTRAICAQIEWVEIKVNPSSTGRGEFRFNLGLNDAPQRGWPELDYWEANIFERADVGRFICTSIKEDEDLTIKVTGGEHRTAMGLRHQMGTAEFTHRAADNWDIGVPKEISTERFVVKYVIIEDYK
jgi:hypothetical protein